MRLEDVQWFTQQVLACEPAMYRLASSILGNDEDAADAAQEAILAAYQKLPSLRCQDSFRPWLMRILTRECYNILRRRKRHVPIDSLPETPALDSSQENLPLWQAVCALSPPLRCAVILYYYEGFCAKEVGSILGITESSVKTRLFRARKHLKLLLEESE